MNKLIIALVALVAVALAAVDPNIVAAVTNAGVVTLAEPYTVTFGADDTDGQAFVAYTAPAGTAYIHVTVDSDSGSAWTYLNPNGFIYTNSSADSGTGGQYYGTSTTERVIGMGAEARWASGIDTWSTDLSYYFNLNDKTIYFSIENNASVEHTVTLTVTAEVMITAIDLVTAGTAVDGTATNSATLPPVYMLTNLAEDYVWEITDANTADYSIYNPMPAVGSSVTDINLMNAGVSYLLMETTATNVPSLTANVNTPTAQDVVWGTPTAAVAVPAATAPDNYQIYVLNFDLTDAQLATMWTLTIAADADLSGATGVWEIYDAISIQSSSYYYMGPAGYGVEEPANNDVDWANVSGDSTSGTTTYTFTKGSTFYYGGWTAGSYQIFLYSTVQTGANYVFTLAANDAIDAQAGSYCSGAAAANVDSVTDGLCTCTATGTGATCADVPAASTAVSQAEPALPANGESVTVTVAAVDSTTSNDFTWEFTYPDAVVNDGAIYVAGVYAFSNTANNAYLLNGSSGNMGFYENAAADPSDASDMSFVGTAGAWGGATGVYVSSAAVDDTFMFVGGWGNFGDDGDESAAFAVNPVVFVVLAALSLVALF